MPRFLHALFRRRRRKVVPDYDTFWAELARRLNLNHYDDIQLARDFRRVFLETTRGRRVLFRLLDWCGEYDVGDDVPPVDPNQLQRYAALRQLAGKIKTAVYADMPAELLEDPLPDED